MAVRGKNVDQMVIWLFGSLLAGFVPVVARYVVHLFCSTYEIFDIKDAVFMGLAMNLSNFNLINDKTLPHRLALTLTSGFVLMVLAFFLGLFQLSECTIDLAKANHQLLPSSPSEVVGYIIFGVTLFSVFLSLFANLVTSKFIFN